jgi:ABC-2 type transport system permease protein
MTSSIGAVALLKYEVRRVVSSPIVWAALALLLIAGIWGARNTARLHADQAADLVRMADQEAEWYAEVRMRAARYALPSSTPVPYWQDPTGASGFSRYFLRRFAAKPHLPLSVLAVGQSDLQPFAVPLRLETLFGGDRVYDYEPPRALATGLFDLAFVLVFVLPLCVGVVVAAIGAQERDQGILPLVAAQPLAPRRWWSTRLAALALILVPGVALVVVVALAIAGAPVADARGDTIAAVALVSAHTLLWLSMAGWCLVRGQSAASTASVIAATWLLLTIAVPLSASLTVRSIADGVSPIADVSELRRTTNDVQRDADAVVARGLVDHFGPSAASVNPASLDYSTRLVLITEEMERRLEPQERRRQEYARTASRVATVVKWLSPQVALHTALADLAGTGGERHQAFLQHVRAFQVELRAFMYPRVLQTVRLASSNACRGCPGRLTFTDYDEIPRFAMQDAPADARRASALRTAAWLGLLAVAIAGIGIGGRAKWALGS